MDARQLIFDLFARRPEVAFDFATLRRAGIAFGISEGSLRTALTRLRKEKRIEARERGLYAVVGLPAPLLQRIRGWRQVLSRRRPWSGAWIVALTGPESRSDRTVWRRAVRGFSLEGFQQVGSDIFTRPDNLEGHAPGARHRLSEFGVPASVVVGSMSQLEPAVTTAWIDAWPLRKLDAEHARLAERLRQSMAKLADRADDKAAAETLLLGRKAIRAILEDPLLPEEWGSSAGLRDLIAAMSKYDSFGRNVWSSYLAARD